MEKKSGDVICIFLQKKNTSSDPKKSGQKTIKNVLFSNSEKWHDPKNKEIISKIEAKTRGFPGLKL
jgi:hypothetical protein